ncbi:DDE-type integrase/transposase/recombinase [Paraburkholderia hospita]|uniref:DDE-type integrase/transposase/recombinase n=1 Tax=Paraburkholderia hospita TaxID=169430 RepID=UPI0009A6F60A|nr:DDE-type integrase/transposase/recombinase [Paraburkholderia hospita]SKC69796.1 Integrase core domain-containing protein [Paraburkholderia hospita]
MATKPTLPTSIARCDLLRKRNDHNVIYIVLKTGEGQRWTHLIDIEHGVRERFHKASPFKLKTEEVLRRLSDYVEEDLALEVQSESLVSFTDRRGVTSYAPHRRSKAHVDAIKNPALNRGWELITKLLTFDIPGLDSKNLPEPLLHGDQFEELLERGLRAKRILRFIKAYKCSEATVRRTLRRFWQRGMTPEAAADDYFNCGGNGKPKNFKRKPGRKARGRALSGAILDTEIRRLLQLAADYYFKPEYRQGKRQSKSLAAAVRWLKIALAKRKVFDEQGLLVDVEFDAVNSITPRQLQYYISKKYSYKQRRIRKVGLWQYLLHERPLTGRLSDTRGPGDRYHIDATIIDVYLVSRNMRSVVVGRATWYVVIDDWSRMAVGTHLTFDPPSWNGAMEALCNAISPKVEYCASLGIEITEDEWPCARLCDSLYADQGEMSSEHFGTPLAVHYRVKLLNAPAYRPDLRSVMESRFKVLPASWMSLVPGAVEKDSFDRGRRHPALDAALNLLEMKTIIARGLLDYNQHAITGYPTPPEMVADGEAPTPLNLWKYGVKVNGCGQRKDVREFRARVMSRGTAKFVEGGISFEGHLYAAPLSLVERQAMFRAERKKTPVEVAFSSADNSTIELLGLGERITCQLADSEPAWKRGLTHREVAKYYELNSINTKNNVADMEASRAISEYNNRETARQAEKQTKEELRARGMTHPDISHLSQMRSAARQEESATDAATPNASAKKKPKSRSALTGFGRSQRGGVSNGQAPEQTPVDGSANSNVPEFDESELDQPILSRTIAEEAEAQAREIFGSV